MEELQQYLDEHRTEVWAFLLGYIIGVVLNIIPLIVGIFVFGIWYIFRARDENDNQKESKNIN